MLERIEFEQREGRSQNCRSESQQRDKSLRLLSLICEFLFIIQGVQSVRCGKVRMLTIRTPRRERRRRRWKGRVNEERDDEKIPLLAWDVETPPLSAGRCRFRHQHMTETLRAERLRLVRCSIVLSNHSIFHLSQHSRLMSTTAPVQTKPAKTKKEKEKEKEREKAERKASLPQQNERLKTVVRRLPPNLPEEIFWNSVQAWVTDETAAWKIYCPGKLRKK